MAYKPILRAISGMGGTGKLRMAQNKAGPVVTDNGPSNALHFYASFSRACPTAGNMIIDADFGLIRDPK